MRKDEQVDRNGFVLQNSWRHKAMLAYAYIDVTNDVHFKLTTFGFFFIFTFTFSRGLLSMFSITMGDWFVE